MLLKLRFEQGSIPVSRSSFSCMCLCLYVSSLDFVFIAASCDVCSGGHGVAGGGRFSLSGVLLNSLFSVLSGLGRGVLCLWCGHIHLGVVMKSFGWMGLGV